MSVDRKIQVLEVFLQVYKLCDGIFAFWTFEYFNLLLPSYFSPEIFILRSFSSLSFPSSSLKIFETSLPRRRDVKIILTNDYFLLPIFAQSTKKIRTQPIELDIRVIVNNKPYRWTLLNNISAWIILQMICFDRRKAFQSLSIHVHRAEINSSFQNDGLFKGKNRC